MLTSLLKIVFVWQCYPDGFGQNNYRCYLQMASYYERALLPIVMVCMNPRALTAPTHSLLVMPPTTGGGDYPLYVIGPHSWCSLVSDFNKNDTKCRINDSRQFGVASYLVC